MHEAVYCYQLSTTHQSGGGKWRIFAELWSGAVNIHRLSPRRLWIAVLAHSKTPTSYSTRRRSYLVIHSGNDYNIFKRKFCARVARRWIAKDIRSLSSQSECAFNVIHCFTICYLSASLRVYDWTFQNHDTFNVLNFSPYEYCVNIF